MIEAVMLWNEPNNLSHWDFEVDPEWMTFSAMTRLAADAVRSVAPEMPCVLGGISPIDPLFVQRMDRQGVLEKIDVIALHGFPLDWPCKLQEIRDVT
jgi:beta-xylosidase